MTRESDFDLSGRGLSLYKCPECEREYRFYGNEADEKNYVCEAEDCFSSLKYQPEGEIIFDNKELDISYCLRALIKRCFDISDNHGFWGRTETKTPTRNIPEALMLIVSEVSEAMEAHRKGDQENFEEELADVAIRLFDLCGGFNIDLEKKIVDKCNKNEGRPYKHNKTY